MIINFFYFLNILVLFSGLLGFRRVSGERKFSITLVQNLLCLPLLAGEYLYLSYNWQFQVVQLILFSETIFGLVWLSLSLRMRQATWSSVHDFRYQVFMEIMFGGVVIFTVSYFLISYSVVELLPGKLIFQMYSLVFFINVYVLITVLYSAWRLEQFWRLLSQTRRWEYKFLVVGGYLICGALAWSSSYRLTYLTIYPNHFLLLSFLLFLSWVMMSYAVVHHRLLNRKIFVSRKVVYSFVLPSFLASYLLGFGFISLIMRTFGVEMSFVLKWLFLALGLVATCLFAFSVDIRRRVHFFISTHFYVNKYEYRDEWLALSHRLQGALNGGEVVKGLRDVLVDSLYTREIFIWLEDVNSSWGYRLVFGQENSNNDNPRYVLGPNDPIVRYLQSHAYFHRADKEISFSWQEVIDSKQDFLSFLNLSLLAPIAIGSQLIGIIGLGPEYTGGEYGYDDFDLLAALGTQTASAMLAVRMAEELARAREQQAWNRLSAFVLHDIKNAATMLSLLQENAPDHIHEPEFQQDMLELVDDALKRMGRVEQQLGALKDEIAPEWQNLELNIFLLDCIHQVKKKLPSMEVTIECSNGIEINSDPELLGSVFENLLLNAFEAGGEETAVTILVERLDGSDQILMKIIDNGPGIDTNLLPDFLFEPFRTSKDEGSGIGLWQVKGVVASLRGNISASNSSDGGAQFNISLPQ